MGVSSWNAIVPDWSWARSQTNRGDNPYTMTSTNNKLALSPGQPLQPSLSGGQEGAKNLPVSYPGDTQTTTRIFHMDNAKERDLTAAAPERGGATDSQNRPCEMPPLTNIAGNRSGARANDEQRKSEYGLKKATRREVELKTSEVGNGIQEFNR